LFDTNTAASALVVTSSPVGAGGSFYNNVPALGSRFIVAEDNNPSVFHDKPFIAADTFPTSANRDNVYVVWIVVIFDPHCVSPVNPDGFCADLIYGSMSTDHALTWSKPEEIDGRSDALCFFGNFFDPTRAAHDCDNNGGADLAVLPFGNLGDLAVVFLNGNTPDGNPNFQQLAVKCHPTGDSAAGTARLNCGEPHKVGDAVIVGAPFCDFGGGPDFCIPGAYIRTNLFPRIAVSRDTGRLYSTWQDYRGGEFDIQLAESSDGGLTWKEAAAPINPDRGKDHYHPAIDVVAGDRADAAKGDHVAISYFRTDRVLNETEPLQCAFDISACIIFAPGQQPGVRAKDSDYFLAGGRRLNTPFRHRRVAAPFPPPDGIQTGFNGDYSGLVLVGNIAHPIWSDTRNIAAPGQNPPLPGQGAVTHDEDVFTDALEVPDSDQPREEGRG
jgi:hypothetical protein